MATPAPPPGFTEVLGPPAAAQTPTARPAPPPGFDEIVSAPTSDSGPDVSGFLRLVGQGAALGFSDEIVAGIRHYLAGEDYEQALADERARVKRFEEANPKTAFAARLGGGLAPLAIPGVGALSAVRGATLAGRALSGAKTGAAYGAVHGAGSAEGDLGDRIEGAWSGAKVGGALGAALPVGGAAIGAGLRKGRDKLTQLGARVTGGDAGVAEQIIANRLAAEGASPASLRGALGQADARTRFHSNSYAESPVALVDVTPSLQKLGGAAGRASGEANTRAEAFIRARQTGLPAEGPGAALIDDAGLTIRNPLSPVSGKGAAGVATGPAGQFERVMDALKRSMTIHDHDFHGHAASAYRTEKDLIEALKARAQQMYPGAYKAASDFDLRPAFANLLAVTQDRAGNHLAVLQRAARLFGDPGTGRPTLGTAGQLKRFQSGKEQLDDMIEVASRAGRDKLAGDLVRFKRDLLASVDRTNPAYAEARGYFSSQMELKDALDAGRNALREGAEATGEQFKALDRGQQKMFRLGLLDAVRQNLGAQKRTADVTQIFERPNVQELLREVIPRTTADSGKVNWSTNISRQPERLGDFIAGEKQFIKTRDVVLGNSKTAERLSDDAALSRDTLSNMVTRLRASGSAVGLGLEVVSVGLNRLFGMRESVAAEIGRRLFTANRAEQEKIIAALERRYGRDRVGALTEFVRSHASGPIATLAGAAGAATAPNQ